MEAVGTGAIMDKIKEYSSLWGSTQTAYEEGKISLEEKSRLQEEYHQEAERYRGYLGYSGGGDGSEYIVKDEGLVSKTTGITSAVLNKTGETIEKLISGHSGGSTPTEERETYKYINNIPFPGYGVLGGDMGQFMSTFKGYLTGDLSADQISGIADEVVKMDARSIEIGATNQSIDQAVEVAAEKYYKSITAFDWLNKNKLWVFGSVVALLGVAILDD